MEETLNVNIGGIAFVINKDANAVLKKYLDELEKHYEKLSERAEIMKDIESRMAELLLEKCDRQEVVTIERVNAVIYVMGAPSDMDDFESDDKEDKTGDSSGKSEGSAQKKAAKRFFRDMTHAKLAGVCAGIGSYFNIDAIILRAALLICVLSYIISDKSWFFGRLAQISIFAYIILWISMPRAKTYVDRCVMKGVDPGVKGAEKNVDGEKPVRGAKVGRFIRIFFGALLFILGVAFLAAGWVVNIGVFDGVTISSLIGSIDMPGYRPFWFSLCLHLLWLLPCLILVYLGIRWMFFIKRPKFRPGLIMGLLWIVSLIVICSWSTYLFNDFNRRTASYSKNTELPKNYDTLYVTYAPLSSEYNGKAVEWEDNLLSYRKITAVDESGNVVYYTYDYGGRSCEVDSLSRLVYTPSDRPYCSGFTSLSAKQGRKRNLFAFYPELILDELVGPEYGIDSTSCPETDKNGKVLSASSAAPIKPKVKISYINFIKKGKAHADMRYVVVKDSLITLYPQIISKESRFKGKYQKVSLSVPSSSVVVIDKRVQ